MTPPLSAVLTKDFCFSACYSRNNKIYASNYKVRLTIPFVDPETEKNFEQNVREVLIEKIHTRDLSTAVDFLKNKNLDDRELALAFWDVLSKNIPVKLLSFCLVRDEDTSITLKNTSA